MFIHIYVVHSISFQTFLHRHLKLSNTLENSLYYCNTSYEMTDQFLWFLQQLEYTLLKSDCQSWWVSKVQSGREDTLEEQYAIRLCFELRKMPQKPWECFRLLFDHLAWIEHQFLSGIRDSRKEGRLWGIMRGVGGLRKSIHQRVRVRVTMLRF